MGKTVNSFRKHEAAGEMAKGLVIKWKKLVPQPADRYVCIPDTVLRGGVVRAVMIYNADVLFSHFSVSP